MSQNIVDVWDGVQNTNSWVHDGDVERSAVDIVELASSVAGYSAGAQAAAAAASGYADTASGAVASIGTAATDAVQAVQNEGTAQISALVDAGGVQTGLIGSAGAAQLADIVTSGGIQISSVGSAGAAQITAITSAGGAQVALVSAAGTSATGDLAAVTAAQSAALVSAGGYQSGLIATAGSAQIAAVQAEGGTQIAAVQLAASAQVSSATVAAMSAGVAASTAQGAASAASGYASAASDSANDAADSATAAQASAESIAASAEQIQTNERNITNIQALLNGTLYREETDSTAAYSKAVPTGAMPYASINEIGGRTVVWNQLARVDLALDTYTESGITITKNSDGSFTANGTSTAVVVFFLAANNSFVGNITLIDTHKYFLTGCPSNGGPSSYSVACWNKTDSGTGIIFTSNTTAGAAQCYIRIAPNFTVSNVVFRPRVIDLTLMFGAGNEPATVAEFEAMFPSINPAYNEGELKSAGVTEVVSDPHNIAVPSVVNVSAIHVFLDADIFRRHFISPGDCIVCTVYKLSDMSNVGDKCSISFWKGNTQTNSASVLPARKIYFKSGGTSGNYINLRMTPDYDKVSIYIPSSLRNIDLGIVCTVGETAITSYIPSRSPVFYPIPSAVQALSGYGWSAGTAYNYIDFERKVYVQNVGSVDLGTLNCSMNSSGLFQVYVSGIKTVSSSQILKNIIAQRYVQITSESIYGPSASNPSLDMVFAQGSSTTVVYFNNLSYTDAAAFKTAMSGVMLYYELATPIETDISSLLTDTTIEVEAGGSLTFRNQNGADWRVPVPNEETYLEQATPELPTTDGTYTLQCTVTDGTPSVTWVTA